MSFSSSSEVIVTSSPLVMSINSHVDVPSFVLPSLPPDSSLVPMSILDFLIDMVDSLSFSVKAEDITRVTPKPFDKFWKDIERASSQGSIYRLTVVLIFI